MFFLPPLHQIPRSAAVIPFYALHTIRYRSAQTCRWGVNKSKKKKKETTLYVYRPYHTCTRIMPPQRVQYNTYGRLRWRQIVAIRKNDWLFLLRAAGGTSKREFIAGDPEGERWRILKIYRRAPVISRQIEPILWCIFFLHSLTTSASLFLPSFLVHAAHTRYNIFAKSFFISPSPVFLSASAAMTPAIIIHSIV